MQFSTSNECFLNEYTFLLPIYFYFSIKMFLEKFIYLLIINNDNFKQLFIIINKNVLNYLKFLFVYIRDRSFYAEHSYFRVYTHVNLYCAGVFVGYFLAKNQHFKMSRVSILLLLFIDFLSKICHDWCYTLRFLFLHSQLHKEEQ